MAPRPRQARPSAPPRPRSAPGSSSCRRMPSVPLLLLRRDHDEIVIRDLGHRQAKDQGHEPREHEAEPEIAPEPALVKLVFLAKAHDQTPIPSPPIPRPESAASARIAVKCAKRYHSDSRKARFSTR